MCGRFTIRTSPREVAELFEVDELPLFAPRYNVAPSQSVLAARLRSDGTRELVPLTWGFVPSWSKDPNSGNRPINVRSETALERPMFRSALRQRRCLIAADGFFEWLSQGKAKQPYYFQRADGKPFAFAGIWEAWRGEGRVLETCALFTTSANETVAPVHDRMPVILPCEARELWLDPEFKGKEQLLALLRPYADDEMIATPVSTVVNSPKNESPQCIVPLNSL